MAAKPSKNEGYSALVQKCQLRPIRTKADYSRALKTCDSLTDRVENLSPDELDYLDVLGDLIQTYEDLQETDEEKERAKQLCTPRNMLMHLMESNDLSQADLVPEFGAASRVSDFLSGKRELSKSQIQKLAERFHVSAVLFLGAEVTGETRAHATRAVRQVVSATPVVQENDEDYDSDSSSQVNLRWTKEALSRVKKVAEKMGVPYQSYIKQVVYRQVIIDEKSIFE